MTEFDNELQTVLDIARQIILDEGELAPVLIVDTEQKGKMLFFFEEFTPEKKHRMLYQIGKMTSELDVRSVVHVAEAWMVRPTNGEMLTVPPSKHPDRQECLILIWSNKPKSYDSKLLLMEHSPDGVIFSEIERETELTVESNLLDSFWKGVQSEAR